MEQTRPEPTATTRQAHFGLWDTICVIVGITIGAGIFRAPGNIFALAGGPWQTMGLWMAGGVLAIAGAMCFAELASTYPRSGGEYIYLTRAFGSWAGFLFAWGQLLIIRTGASMVVMAYVFAEFALRFAGIYRDSANYANLVATLALVAVVALTAINIVGVRSGKWTQNILTAAKVLGIGGVLIAGFAWANSRSPEKSYVAYEGQVVAAGDDSLVLSTNNAPSGRPFVLAPGAKLTLDGKEKNEAGKLLKPEDLRGKNVKVLTHADEPTKAVRVKATQRSLFTALTLALIYVLWTYAGWHEAAYIVAEVRDHRRMVPLALLLGTGVVIAIYLLTNLAYLFGLGYEDAADAKEIAADVLALSPWRIEGRPLGELAVCILIMISSLGAVNGIIFTSSRIFSEFGADHALFAPMGRWSSRLGTPVVALLVQGGIAVFTILIVAIFDKSLDSFDLVVRGTAPVFWLLFLLTGVAFFALRIKDKGIHRPFSVPLYPLTPLIYCAICGLLLYGSTASALEEKLSGWFVVVTLLAVLAGLPLFWLSEKLGNRRRKANGVDQPQAPLIAK